MLLRRVTLEPFKSEPYNTTSQKVRIQTSLRNKRCQGRKDPSRPIQSGAGSTVPNGTRWWPCTSRPLQAGARSCGCQKSDAGQKLRPAFGKRPRGHVSLARQTLASTGVLFKGAATARPESKRLTKVSLLGKGGNWRQSRFCFAVRQNP